MTTFHWHVVDSQSFPLQIDGYMELSETGAYDNSSVYTSSDVADIVSYAGAVCASSFLGPRYLLIKFTIYSGVSML